MSTQIVILAAGMGSRLGRSLPKPLTELSDGRTIMQQQFDNIRYAFGNNAKVTIVVGYKLEHIIEAFPEANFVYNEQYDQTNTSKSLLRALQASSSGGVLWMNGDVVFDPRLLELVGAAIAEDRLGSLQPGRLADFLFLDRDIFRTSNPNEIRETQVLETWLGGTKVWDQASRPQNAPRR